MDENNYDDFFVKVKIISIGEKFLKNFVCNYPKFELCLVNEKISDSEIEKLVSDCEWLFVVADEKNLDVAKKIEKSAKCFLVTNLFLFPTAEDIKISELEKDFGTVIVLPEDKISELNFERNALLTKIISSMILTIGDTTYIGLSFVDLFDVMKNSGIMYASLGEGVAGSKPIEIIKKSLKNNLLNCYKSHMTKTFVSLVGRREEFSMIKINEAVNFIFDYYFKDIDNDIYWRVAIDENTDGIRVLILTN